MPLCSFVNFCWAGRLRTFCFLLQILAIPIQAADQRLWSTHVPRLVAQGKLAPLGRVPATNQMRLAISLPLRDPAGLTNLLAAIYNPASPAFHHYLTPVEFTARFGPTPAEYAAVIEFARTNGLMVTANHRNRLLVDVTGSVAAVERAFRVRLSNYRHPREPRNFFAPDSEPVVAAGLPLFHVSGLDNYSVPHPNLCVRTNAASAPVMSHGGSSPYNGSYLGEDFRRAYVPETALTGAGQNVGLLQFDGFYAADITNYANAIGLTNNAPRLVVVSVDGGVATPGSGNIEVALDLEMVMSMSPGVSNIYVYEAPNPSPWVDLLSRMANDNLAKQLSCSWGGGGSDPAAEQIFQQMAAQGQSFFNASGDSDAFTGAVEFPSDSPNIMQVGGTTLTTDTNADYISETVWNWGGGQGGSGGISGYYSIPYWQLGLDMTTNQGSLARRNLPDVALTADNVYVIYGNGLSNNVGGTSCAAPLWAGLTALVNQQSVQLSQPSVGFMNPALYALARGTNYQSLFNDITTGNNTSVGSPTNFFAVPGYDLCTGLGTPRGTNFINALTTPENLGILPATTFNITGAAGGPFAATNIVVTLTNTGADSLDWSLGVTSAWLAASPVGGTLTAHGTATVSVMLPNAGALAAGNYLGAVEITNQALSRVELVAVNLIIGQSIVQNGSFESGDFTGWMLVGDTVIGNLVYNAVATDYDFPGLAHSGYYGAFLGQSGYVATLTQSLATTPGQRYLVSCWLNNPPASAGGPQLFSARWNGVNIVNLVNPPVFTWTNFQFVVTATATNTPLQFAAENDPNYFGFDDVTVTPVPAVTFSRLTASTDAFQLSWNSLAGLSYQVQYKTNLAQAGWLSLANLSAVANVTTFTDPNSLSTIAQRFYRLVLLP